jgi:uncharacterized protein YndB with AHSA1/START domain
MKQSSYSTVVLVGASPQAAYDAINDVRAWWSEDLEGDTDAVGAAYDFRGNHEGVNVHRARIRVTELVPGERVAWHVEANEFTFTEDQDEWVDTRIVFELTPSDEGTRISFRHEGLVPVHECYDVCSNAWWHFLHDSLRGLIETGQGEPMLRLDEAQPARSA